MPIYSPQRVIEEQIRMQRPCKGCMYLAGILAIIIY